MVNCIINQYSLFEIRAGENLILGEISKEDLVEKSKNDPDLKEIIDDIRSNFLPQGRKYDFDYFNLKQHQERRNDINIMKMKSRKDLSLKKIPSV